jgi:NitT/TauT family transport system permease protein
MNNSITVELPSSPTPRKWGHPTWNASIVSEYVQFNNHIVSTFGLGASIASAAAATPAPNFPVLLAATLLMAAFVVILNRLVWKRLYGLAERRYTLG